MGAPCISTSITVFSGPPIMIMRRSIRMQEYSELYSFFAHTYFQSFWLSMIIIIKSISSRSTHHLNIGSLRCLRETVTRLIMRQVILWTPFIAAVLMCFGSSCIREMFVECKPSFSYHKLIHDRTSRLSQRLTDRRYVNLLLNPMCDCPSIYKHIYHSIQVSASNSSGVSSPSRILMIGVVTRTVVDSGALRCWSYR